MQALPGKGRTSTRERGTGERRDAGVAGHPLGTDDQGRDVLSTIMYGARISLGVGVAAVIFALVLGVSLGLVSGYFGGRLDAFIMRIADIQLSFPAILIALLVDGVARDPRCENCMVHCGYDPSGALGTNYQRGDNWKNFKYNFSPRPQPYAGNRELTQTAFNGFSVGKGHLAAAKAAIPAPAAGDNGAASLARLANPAGLFLDRNGSLSLNISGSLCRFHGLARFLSYGLPALDNGIGDL